MNKILIIGTNKWYCGMDMVLSKENVCRKNNFDEFISL